METKKAASDVKMPSNHDLSDFDRGIIVGAREMGHSISEVATKFGFSRTTVSRVYRDYKNSGKTSNLRQQCGRRKTLGERDQDRLARIVSRDRHATLPEITSEFNAEASTNISVRTVQRSLHDMGFWSRRPTLLPLMNAYTIKARNPSAHLSTDEGHSAGLGDDTAMLDKTEEDAGGIAQKDNSEKQSLTDDSH